MIDRNTIVGIDFLVVGFTLASLGYILAQSIPITAIGVEVAILGALILLIVKPLFEPYLLEREKDFDTY